MGHDADVAHIVGAPLQLNQLLGRDDGHRGGGAWKRAWARFHCADAKVVPAGQREATRRVVEGAFRQVSKDCGRAACVRGARACDRGRGYVARRVVAGENV
jgi:hypothetical protein